MKFTSEIGELFLAAPIGLAITDTKGSFTHVNGEFLNITGYTDEEFQALSYWDLTPAKYEEQEQEQLESLKKYKKYGPYEKEYIHKNGHMVKVLLNGTIINDENGVEYVYSTVSDITNSKKSEEVLNKAQEMAHIGHWYLDLTTGELAWSDETYRIFGLKPQEFAATYDAFVERIYEDDRDAVNAAYAGSLETNVPYQIEHRVIRPDGEIRYVIERCEHYVDKDGTIIGSVGIVIDVTQSRENENALIEAKNRAENANIAKSSFIANMSHELRTPLNAIIGFSSMMSKDETINEKSRKHIGIVHDSGEHLLEIINEILEMSKIEAGKMKVKKTEFNLRETIDKISALMSEQVKSSEVTCNLSFDEKIDRFISSDEGKIRQIIFNLIGNAIKFTKRGSIGLSLSTQKGLDGIHLYVDITDTGCGIDASMHEEIFKPFVQNNGVKKVEGGTGLGLAITKELVDELGGKISLESKVGEGSKFSVILPIELASESFIKESMALQNTKTHENTNSTQEPEVAQTEVKEIDFSKVPSEILKNMLNASKVGSRLKVKKEIEKIKDLEPSLYSKLGTLIDEYNFDGINDLLKEYDD